MKNKNKTIEDTFAMLKMIEQSKAAYSKGEYKIAQQAFSDIRIKNAARSKNDVR
jgi:hypothetical protein